MPDSLLLAAPVSVDILQFHVLTALPPHKVNRDADSLPKACLPDGAGRGRTPNRTKKRVLRFAPHFAPQIPNAPRSPRTREVGILAFRRLTAAGIDETFALWAALAVNRAVGSGSATPTLADAETLLSGGKNSTRTEVAESTGEGRAPRTRNGIERALRAEQGLTVSAREFMRLDNALKGLITAWQQDATGFASILASWVKRVCDESLLTQADRDLDTALFGRTVSADAAFDVEAAYTARDSLATHSFAIGRECFSAVETLSVLDGTGAAIASYAFFGDGVYYQHAVLDRRRLRRTLSEGRTVENAERLAVEAENRFLSGLLFTQPTGKWNSHTSSLTASYVLATRGGDPPLNLGLAFLGPILPDEELDLMQTSIARLMALHNTTRAVYGLKNAVCVFNARPASRVGDTPQAPEVWTVKDLHRFVLGLPGRGPMRQRTSFFDAA